MAYKDIVVFADATKAARLRFDVAVLLAAAHKARLVALHIATPPYTPADIMATIPAALAEWQARYMQEEMEATKMLVDATRRRTSQDIEWLSVSGDYVSTALNRSRYADLLIVSQGAQDPDDVSPADALPETLLMESERPVLIVPRHGKFTAIGETVLVAWNRSREAARAVHDAMPALERAKHVPVLEVDPPKDSPTDADLADHLATHNVKSEIASTTADKISIGDAILSHAADLHADLLVMGAYGHSRLREYVLGGATRHMLEHMTLPVLMAH